MTESKQIKSYLLIGIFLAAAQITPAQSSTSASSAPKLIPFKDTFVWDQPSAFGPVPDTLLAKGNEICSSLNRDQSRFQATGYHPRALDAKGIPFKGGGFYCELIREGPVMAAATSAATLSAPDPAQNSVRVEAPQPRATPSVNPAPASTASSPTPSSPPEAATPLASPSSPPTANPKTSAKADTAKLPLLEQVQEKMKVWRDAWESRNAEAYLELYDPSFPNWKAYSERRKQRILAAKFIKVNMLDVIYREEAETVVVRFKQVYRSDTHKSSQVKELIWKMTPSGARIVEERNIREAGNPKKSAQ